MLKLDPQQGQLLMQMYDLRREEKLRKARAWILGSFWAETVDEFNAVCPPGSDENAYYRQVTTYWETMSLMVNRGMVDEDLYFESSAEGLLTWLRVRKVALAMRQTRKNPLILRNLETLSERHEKWYSTHAPEALPEIQKGMAAMRQKANAVAR
jgi:hypothetical protein